MLYDVLPYLATAAVVSLPWFIAYRSQTGYLKQECGRLEHHLNDERACSQRWFDKSITRLAEIGANKLEIERLREENKALKAFKAKRNMSRTQRAKISSEHGFRAFEATA